MKKYKYILIQIMLVIFMFSCSNDELDSIDTDPNNPTEVSLDLLLPQVEMKMVNNVFASQAAMYFSTYTEHTANVHLNTMLPQDKNTALWNDSYDIMMDLNIIIERGTTEEKWLHVGVAKVIYAFVLGNLTDIFGDVPYSEALLGSENRNPKYDSQEDIYNALFDILDDAISDFQKNEVIGISNYDLILKGDKSMWLKTAWGLKARYLNRLSNIDPTGSATDAIAALKNSFSTASEEISFLDYTDGSINTNIFAKYEQSQKTYAASLTILNVIAEFNEAGYNDDPRATRWFNKIDGAIVGAPNGENVTDQSHAIYSGISTENVLYGTAAQPLLTFEELKFIEAEAYLRLNKKAEANAAYKLAVEAACLKAGLTDSELSAYTAQGNVFVDDNSLSQDMIMKQKFLSFFMMQPFEAFNDYRRTGIPALYNTVEGIVKRLPYPTGELAVNSNAPTDINNVTIYTIKVWWAK